MQISFSNLSLGRSNPLKERAQSGFPVSIGTGLALETVFSPTTDVADTTRQVPTKVEHSTYNLYLINVSTLVRNLLSSVSYANLVGLPSSMILETLLEEIEYLQGLFTMNDLHLQFYVNTYAFPTKTYQSTLRLQTTDQQIQLGSYTSYCLDHIKKQDEVKVFDNKLSYEVTSKALVLTHVPWDLLSHTKFHRLDLLESHTGLVKTRKEWNSKYYPVPKMDMSFLPFIEYLLVHFGDGIMFRPDKLEDRLDLYKQMEKKKVHPLMDEMSFSFLRGIT